MRFIYASVHPPRHCSDMQTIREGLRDKVPVLIQWCSTWLCAYVIAFVKGWKLALAVVAFSPLFITMAATVTKVTTMATSK